MTNSAATPTRFCDFVLGVMPVAVLRAGKPCLDFQNSVVTTVCLFGLFGRCNAIIITVARYVGERSKALAVINAAVHHVGDSIALVLVMIGAAASQAAIVGMKHQLDKRFEILARQLD